MEASNHDFNHHVSDCNKDFRENIMKKIHVTKLKDTSLLNKKVSYKFKNNHKLIFHRWKNLNNKKAGNFHS